MLGTATSTLSQAPVSDPSWEIWTCSPGMHKTVPRIDRFFELHDLPHLKERASVFFEDLKSVPFPVYTFGPPETFPTGVAYPRDAIGEAFGEWFLTSTVAWMIALAIHEGADEIGLWGVDMGAQEEYAHQKAGCLHFVTIALKRGIKVHIPKNSELLVVAPPYPFNYESPHTLAIKVRRKKLQDELKQVQSMLGSFREAEIRLTAQIDALESLERTFMSGAIQ